MLYFAFLMFFAGSACNPTTETIQAEDDDIAGVVTGPKGPEAGVWVIAETFDLLTRYAKIVVTDEKGQYLIPDIIMEFKNAYLHNRRTSKQDRAIVIF